MKTHFFFFLNIFFLASVFSQEPFSFDKNSKKIHLKNGLDCYLHPLKQEQKIVFYLLLKVGSLQENENQLGYAHFLEHIAFRGGKSFQNKSFVTYLKNKGLEMGKHFNAITGYQKTLYEFTIPNQKQILDTLFLFSKDLLNGDLIFTQKNLEQQRKIILEEKRIRPAFQENFNWKLSKKYLQRIPIGTQKSISETTIKSLKKFYENYYAPQHATLIITGNFEKAYAQKQIQKYLAPIPNQFSKIKAYHLYEHLKTKFQKKIDSTLKNPKIIWQQARKTLVKKRPDAYKKMLAEKILRRIVEHRLKILQKTNAYDFWSARRYFLGNTDFYTLEIASENILQTLQNIFKIYREIAIHGVPTKHLQIHKKNYANFVKMDFSHTKNTKSWAEAYLDYVITGNAPMANFSLKKWQKTIFTKMNSEDLKNCANAFFNHSKNLIRYEYPLQKQTIKKKVFQNLYQTWKKKNIPSPHYILPEKIQNLTKSKKLKTPKINPQKPTKETYFPNLGITHWFYKNGAAVFVKPMKNKQKAIRFIGFAKGGTSFLADSLYYKYASTVGYMELGGVGNLNHEDLAAFLDDKMISFAFGVTEHSRKVYGYTFAKDLKNFFKYFYLKMTQASTDEKSFQEIIAQEISDSKKQKNQKQPPIFKYQKMKACLEAKYFLGRKTAENSKQFKNLSLPKMQKFYNQSFSKPQGWRYVCMGNFTIEQIKPLLNKYLGGMTGHSKFPHQKKLFDPKKYPKYQVIDSKKNKNKTKMHYVFYGTFKGPQPHLKLKLAMYLLRTQITEKMRIQQGWVYTPLIYENIHLAPTPFYTISITYSCKPENKNKLQKMLLKIFEELTQNNIKNELLDQAKRNRILAKKEIFESNNLYKWAFTLSELLHEGVKIKDLENFEKQLSKITKKEIQLFLQNTLRLDNFKILEYK